MCLLIRFTCWTTRKLSLWISKVSVLLFFSFVNIPDIGKRLSCLNLRSFTYSDWFSVPAAMNPVTLLIFTFLILESHAQLLASPNSLLGQTSLKTENYDPDAICPKAWVHYTTSCYKFIRSPIKTRDEARQYCRAFNSDLASVNSLEEHSFITTYLNKQDPSHRIWYISGRQQSPGVWVNDGDGTTMMNLDTAFLPNQETVFEKDFLSYGYSLSARQWGLLRVDGKDPLLHICEIASNRVCGGEKP